jgi:hypothetical protein
MSLGLEMRGYGECSRPGASAHLILGLILFGCPAADLAPERFDEVGREDPGALVIEMGAAVRVVSSMEGVWGYRNEDGDT